MSDIQDTNNHSLEIDKAIKTRNNIRIRYQWNLTQQLINELSEHNILIRVLIHTRNQNNSDKEIRKASDAKYS